MSAAEILRLIETVSPDDTAKLDEIDARVWCYLIGFEFARIEPTDCPFEHPTVYFNLHCTEVEANRASCGDYGMTRQSYTRSRDALKQIRPEGCHMVCGHNWAKAVTAKKDFYGNAPTEELAELYAILQAIQYERQSNDR